MNNDIICKSELISRFMDNELEGDEFKRVEAHIAGCDSCRIRLSDYGKINTGLNAPLYPQSENVAGEFENRVIEAIKRKENSGYRNWKDYLFNKRVLVQAGLAASAALMFFTVFNDPAPAGPSAIISSLSGPGSSVMIMEIPETRQTILWFNENG
jgi:anti-sigma factor RsiW